MSLAAEIKRLRKKAGSHDKFAAQLGTTRQAVIRWEKGGFPRDYVAQLQRAGIPAELLERPATPERLEQLEGEVTALTESLGLAEEAARLLEERVAALEADAPGVRRRKASSDSKPSQRGREQ